MDDYRALIFLGVIALVVNHYWHKSSAISEKVKRISKALKTFSLETKTWDEKHLKKVARTTFKAYAAAMDTLHAFNLSARGPNFYEEEIEHLLHPKATPEVKTGNTYYCAYESVLAQTKSEFDVSIIHARNSTTDSKDCFTACIDSVNLQLINYRNIYRHSHSHARINGRGNDLYVDGRHVKEFWTFQRHEDQWLLLCIHDEQHWEMFTDMRILDDGPAVKKKA